MFDDARDQKNENDRKKVKDPGEMTAHPLARRGRYALCSLQCGLSPVMNVLVYTGKYELKVQLGGWHSLKREFYSETRKKWRRIYY